MSTLDLSLSQAISFIIKSQSMTKEQSSQIDTSLCLSSMTVSDYGADQRLSMTVVRSKTAKFVNDRAESRILDTGGRIFSLSLT